MGSLAGVAPQIHFIPMDGIDHRADASIFGLSVGPDHSPPNGDGHSTARGWAPGTRPWSTSSHGPCACMCPSTGTCRDAQTLYTSTHGTSHSTEFHGAHCTSSTGMGSCQTWCKRTSACTRPCQHARGTARHGLLPTPVPRCKQTERNGGRP